MKKLVIAVFGMVPVLIGMLMNWAMVTVWPTAALPLGLIAVVFLLFWFCLAYALSGWIKNPAEGAALLGVPGCLVLVLLAIQEYWLGAYWQSLVGTLTQEFFLPVMYLGFNLTTWSHRIFPAYCAAFLLMFAAACLGGYAGKKRQKQTDG